MDNMSNYKLILLPTQEATNLYFNKQSNELRWSESIDISRDGDANVNQVLYLVSDEKIEIGNYFIYNGGGELSVQKCTAISNEHTYSIQFGYTKICCKKIISSTDTCITNTYFIDKEERMKVIEFYNKYGELPEVNIEKGSINDKIILRNNSIILKITSESIIDIRDGAAQIVIRKKGESQERMYSKKQIIDFTNWLVDIYDKTGLCLYREDSKIFTTEEMFDKWVKENLK